MNSLILKCYEEKNQYQDIKGIRLCNIYIDRDKQVKKSVAFSMNF